MTPPSEVKTGKRRWGTALTHPSYSIEECPSCGFPESDGGYCPECGWTRFTRDCPHCKKEGLKK